MPNDAAAFLAARDLLLQHRTDPAAARAHFQWPELHHFNWALDHFDPMAADNQTPALRIVGPGSDDETITFAALAARSNQVANGLRRIGVQRGDRILLLLGNVRPLWEAMLAAIKLGAVVIPATTMLTEDDLQDRFARGRVQHVIADAALAPKFAAIPGPYTRIAVGPTSTPTPPGWTPFDFHGEPETFTPDAPTRATDPLLLYFTSGTTSKPKLVLHTHQSYPVGHLSTLYWIGLQPGDTHLNISSPGWAKHAWSSFFAPWIAGATILILNQPRFDAPALLETLSRCNVTTFCAPPIVWRMLVQEDLTRHPMRLREVVAAGEPLNPEVIARIRAAWNLDIRDGYGQTETTLQIANTPGQPLTPGSMGRALPGYRVALLDPDGRETDEGEIALLLDHAGGGAPLGLMAGYLQPDGTVLPPTGPAYRTGDVALRNPDDTYTYVGRADDVFKSSGYRISPFELESVLIEHPAVAEAAVVPVPDPTRTALPKAFIVLAEGHPPDAATAASVFAHLRARLAPYKRVKRLAFGPLPKTISGKIRRVELRRAEAQRAEAGETAPGEFRDE